MRACECGCEPSVATDEFGPIVYWELRCPRCGTTTGLCPTPEEAEGLWEGGIVSGPCKWIEELGDE